MIPYDITCASVFVNVVAPVESALQHLPVYCWVARLAFCLVVARLGLLLDTRFFLVVSSLRAVVLIGTAHLARDLDSANPFLAWTILLPL